jgi:hypothetical protein
MDIDQHRCNLKSAMRVQWTFLGLWVHIVYLEMKKTDFEKENRAGLKFQVDFIKHLEKHWEVCEF